MRWRTSLVGLLGARCREAFGCPARFFPTPLCFDVEDETRVCQKPAALMEQQVKVEVKVAYVSIALPEALESRTASSFEAQNMDSVHVRLVAFYQFPCELTASRAPIAAPEF